MNAATERVPRLLALVPYLLARPGIKLVDAANDFGVSPKQLRKDLELLWMCGLPGYGPGDLIDLSFEGETITVTYDAGMNRPLRLTGGEATALSVALRALAETPGMFDTEAVSRALAKIEIAAGKAHPAGVVVDSGKYEAESTTHKRTLIQQALTEHRALHIRYYTASRDAITERTIDPVSLVVDQAVTYLQAWCRVAEGMRHFRLDRIDDITVLAEAAVLPADVTPPNTSQGIFPMDDVPRSADVVLEPEVRWVAEYYPCEEIGELPEGRLRIRLPYGEESWLIRLILGLGGKAHIEQPAELADKVRDHALAGLTRARHVTYGTEQ